MIYIYGLNCPVTGKIRYIGKCKQLETRLRSHVSKARLFQTNHHSARWIRSLLDQGLRPTICVLRELPNGSNWQEAEKELIRYYRDAGFDLTNLTGGGDGFHDVHPEILRKRGESRSRNLKNPEVNAKFRKSLRAAQSKPDVRKRHSAAAKSLWQDPAYRQRAMSGMSTESAIKNRSQATKKRNSDPEFAARHAEKMKERFKDPAAKEQLRQASLKRWADWRSAKQGKNSCA